MLEFFEFATRSFWTFIGVMILFIIISATISDVIVSIARIFWRRS